jgi:hypothetical protein
MICEFLEITFYVRVSDHRVTCQGSYSYSSYLEDACILSATSSTDGINWGSPNTILELQDNLVIYFASSSSFHVESIFT